MRRCQSNRDAIRRKHYRLAVRIAYEVLLDMRDARAAAKAAMVEFETSKHHHGAHGPTRVVAALARRKAVDRLLQHTAAGRLHVQACSSLLEVFVDKQLLASLGREKLVGLIPDAFHKLDPRQRKVLILRHIAGHSVDEIAWELKLPPSVIGPLLAEAEERGRLHMRKLSA